MKVSLEVTGGFAGPAGKQRVEMDTDTAQLSPSETARLTDLLERLPAETWSKRFVAPHPKSWDFLHVLSLEDGHGPRSVTFHLGQGPQELTALAEWLLARHASAR